MPVVVVHQGPSLTQEAYEEAVSKLTDGKSRLEATSDWPVEGILVHTQEAFGRFGEKLGPILQEIGVDDPPEVYPAHTFVSA